MASKIRVLSEHTINQIAAGEVIENPASVVKELVENSLDAGATDICIEIKGGGRQMIRISDNGCGMHADDALLCLERHATSKIRDAEELHGITTMGFRGEAIPSIAAISKFMLLTCPQPTSTSPEETGTMIIVDGGKILSCSPAARAPGTTVEVKALFFNVPVRKKFLKSPAVDANEILKTVTLLALGYPQVKFQLLSEGKNLLMAPLNANNDPHEQLKSRIAQVFGADFLQNTSGAYAKNEGMSVYGFIGSPSYTRHNRTGQFLFINHRAVFSPLVAYAIKMGYGTALENNRHPVFVLHLNLPGEIVDVNVHPQKREVRLRQEGLLKELLVKAVAHALQSSFRRQPAEEHFPQISPVFANHWHSSPSDSLPLPDKPDKPEPWIFTPQSNLKTAMGSGHKTHSFDLPSAKDCESKECVLWPDPIAVSRSMSAPPLSTQEVRPESIPHSKISSEELSLPLTPSYPVPRVLATLPRYILLDPTSLTTLHLKGVDALSKGNLVVVDQKATHARIIFEKLWQQQEGANLAQQSLLIPYQFEVAPFEAPSWRACLPFFNELGIHMHEFGPNTFMIDAIPQVFGNSQLETLVADLMHTWRQVPEDATIAPTIKQERLKQVALTASRAAVSNQRRLSMEEAQMLLDQLFKCHQPYHCPAGKPTIAVLPTEELAKLFQK